MAIEDSDWFLLTILSRFQGPFHCLRIQKLTWRTLCATMMSCFTLNFFLSGVKGKWGTLYSMGLLNFGVGRQMFSEALWLNLDQLPFGTSIKILSGQLDPLYLDALILCEVPSVDYCQSIWAVLSYFELVNYWVGRSFLSYAFAATFAHRLAHVNSSEGI